MRKESKEMKKRSKILISCLMMVILAAAMMTGCSKKEEAKPEPVRNPLTGSEKFDSAAQGIRPVALVGKTLRMPARSGE